MTTVNIRFLLKVKWRQGLTIPLLQNDCKSTCYILLTWPKMAFLVTSHTCTEREDCICFHELPIFVHEAIHLELFWLRVGFCNILCLAIKHADTLRAKWFAWCALSFSSLSPPYPILPFHPHHPNTTNTTTTPPPPPLSLLSLPHIPFFPSTHTTQTQPTPPLPTPPPPPPPPNTTAV